MAKGIVAIESPTLKHKSRLGLEPRPLGPGSQSKQIPSFCVDFQCINKKSHVMNTQEKLRDSPEGCINGICFHTSQHPRLSDWVYIFEAA